MNSAAHQTTDKAIDSVQQRFADYAAGLRYEDLSADAVHAATSRVIDTLGTLIGGYFGAPCALARNLAAQMPCSGGATIVGPLVIGLSKPVQIVQMGATVSDLVNTAAIAAYDAIG